MKAQVHNCQVLVDLASRNALWGAAAHLFMAFKPLAPAPKPNSSAQHAAQRATALHRGSSGLPRAFAQGSGGTGLVGQPSFSHQGEQLSAITLTLFLWAGPHQESTLVRNIDTAETRASETEPHGLHVECLCCHPPTSDRAKSINAFTIVIQTRCTLFYGLSTFAMDLSLAVL